MDWAASDPKEREIVHIHIRDGIVGERLHVDIDALDLLGRLHGADWCVTLRDRFQVIRQTPDSWKQRPRPTPEGELP